MEPILQDVTTLGVFKEDLLAGPAVGMAGVGECAMLCFVTECKTFFFFPLVKVVF